MGLDSDARRASSGNFMPPMKLENIDKVFVRARGATGTPFPMAEAA